MAPGRCRHFITTIAISALCLQVFGDTAPALSAPPPKTVSASFTSSYLPVTMQVLAHLTNQMTFENLPPSDATSTTTKQPTSSTTTSKTTKATSQTTTTEKPTTEAAELTTRPHKPANFAPLSPPPIPKGAEFPGIYTGPEASLLVPPIVPGLYPSEIFLPQDTEPAVPVIKSPYPQHSPHYIRDPFPIQEAHFPVVLFPSHTYFHPKSPNSEPMFLPGIYGQDYNQPQLYGDWLSKARQSDDEESFSISDGSFPDLSLLPVQNENNFKYNPLELMPDELSDENLQYLAPNVRELIKGINTVQDVKNQNKNNPSSNYQSIEELFDNAEERKTFGEWLKLRKSVTAQSYVHMILLYDMLSRDAKTQKLNNYNGYSKELLKDLNDLSKNTATEQLKVVLERMVARGDCKNDFANNRAKDLAIELTKPNSKTSMEIKNLKPLRFLE